MFGSLVKTAKKLGERISEDVTKLSEKISADQKELSERDALYGSLWEANESVSFCRSCNKRFTPLERKHHCRGCAGIFCESCTDFDLSVSQSDYIRGCEGCARGECPGSELKLHIRSIIDASSKNDKDALDHIVIAGARLSSTLGYRVGVPPSTSLRLSRGSRYGEDGRLVSAVHPIPVSGYLEITNKSTEMCAIKILSPGGNEVFEVPRPSYMALPPSETCHTEFPPKLDALFVIFLYNNPQVIPSGAPLIYDTSASGVTNKRISPCAQIANFLDVAIYKVQCKDHNVLLKYQTGGTVAARLGNSASRVGVFSALQGKRFAKNRIDFATNVSSADMEEEFRASARSGSTRNLSSGSK